LDDALLNFWRSRALFAQSAPVYPALKIWYGHFIVTVALMYPGFEKNTLSVPTSVPFSIVMGNISVQE
jgi:hypothetical protein